VLAGWPLWPRRPIKRARPMKDPCALCGRFPASARGEHVYPRWLIRHLFPPADGPYTMVINGAPLLRRDGATPHSDDHFPPLLLPVCDTSTGGRCNPTLSARFEQAAMKGPVKTMLAGGILDEDAAHRASLWWMKTALLASHPKTVRKLPDTKSRVPVWDDPIEPHLWHWMINGTEPPAGMSLWVAVVNANADGLDRLEASETTPRIDLPTFFVGDEICTSRVSDFGIANLQLHLLVHPGWEAAHPLERDGLAIRLVPWPGGNLDMSTLPSLGGPELRHWLHLWGAPVTLSLEPGHDPRDAPWVLGPGWAWGAGVAELPGVSGARW
jgi:hypothetical protein